LKKKTEWESNQRDVIEWLSDKSKALRGVEIIFILMYPGLMNRYLPGSGGNVILALPSFKGPRFATRTQPKAIGQRKVFGRAYFEETFTHHETPAT
jgi:hypothetical protein